MKDIIVKLEHAAARRRVERRHAVQPRDVIRPTAARDGVSDVDALIASVRFHQDETTQ